MSSLSGSGQGRFYIIGNCISYYTKKPPSGWHEVSLCFPDVEGLILLNWKIIFIYVTMIIFIHKSN